MKENPADEFDSLFVKKKSGWKVFAIIFSISVLILSGIYTYLTISAVRARMNAAQSLAQGTETVNPELIDLMKEKAWVESRLKMASNDSVCLSIDLQQQLIQLELKGVVVLTSKIREYSTSGFFRKMDGSVYFAMFGTPLTISSFKSSIEKNPFKVVKAPESAEEAEKAVVKKDSIPDEIVYWTVKLDRDIELNIQGIDSISEAQNKYKLGKGFEFKRDLKNIANSFQHIIKFEKPTYTPEILISIRENEAKAILRALPRKASVTIRI